MTDEELAARFTEIDLRLERLAQACKYLADNDQEIVTFIGDLRDSFGSLVGRKTAATLGTAAEPRPVTNDRQSGDIPADRAESPATLGSFVGRGNL